MGKEVHISKACDYRETFEGKAGYVPAKPELSDVLSKCRAANL